MIGCGAGGARAFAPRVSPPATCPWPQGGRATSVSPPVTCVPSVLLGSVQPTCLLIPRGLCQLHVPPTATCVLFPPWELPQPRVPPVPMGSPQRGNPIKVPFWGRFWGTGVLVVAWVRGMCPITLRDSAVSPSTGRGPRHVEQGQEQWPQWRWWHPRACEDTGGADLGSQGHGDAASPLPETKMAPPSGLTLPYQTWRPQLCPHPSWQRSHLPPPFPTTAFPRQAHDDNTSARTQHGDTPCVCPSRPHCAPSAISSLPRLTAQWRRAHAQCAQVTAGNLPVPNMAAPTTSALPLAGAPRACAAPRAPWRRCGRCGGSAAPRG